MRVTLATRITTTIVGVLVIALIISIVGLVAAYHFQSNVESMVVENMASVRAAEELEIALLEQRGYVASYMLDGGDRRWLEPLDGKGASFNDWLTKARATAHTREEHAILDRLESVHREYDRRRDEAVALFDAGETERAKQVLLDDVTSLYGEAYDRCEEFIAMNDAYVQTANARAHREVQWLTVMIALSVGLTFITGGVLLWFFFNGVVFPLRRMAAEARSFAGSPSIDVPPCPGDELREVGGYLRLLMADVAETRSDLQRSRDRLAQAEKLATVGKLAASVAHEIRNPLTAMKMWLFSLRKTLGREQDTARKFDLVSDEIARLENVVQHFLEFSKPPPLRRQRLDVTGLVANTLELFGPRLTELNISNSFTPKNDLPALNADAQQLKQVFLNLFANAIEAMPEGGRVEIDVAQEADAADRTVVVARVRDTGRGMSREVKSRIFEPFFTTKDNGTGLGLCIAARIMARHGGRLVLESSTDQGSCFAVHVPVEIKDGDEQDPNC